MSTKTNTQPGDADSLPDLRVPEIYTIQLAISLLVMICLAALASFSLAPSFLTKVSLTGQPVQKTLASSTTSKYSDGICTTNPQGISYQQQPKPTKSPPPAAWSNIGLTSQDLTNAQICAGSFTNAYETFDIKQASSLTAATPMLSVSAKQHFFAGTVTEPKDPHVDATWLTQAQKEQLQQSAALLKPAVLQTAVKTSQAGTVTASFIVSYTLTTTSSGRSSTKQQQLLIYVARAAAGWQVIDWKSMS